MLRRLVENCHWLVWPSVDLKYAVSAVGGAYHAPQRRLANTRREGGWGGGGGDGDDDDDDDDG